VPKRSGHAVNRIHLEREGRGRPFLSVTLKDCDVQEFRVGGAGGQHRDKTSAGIRIVHPPSRATGRATESRSQLENKKTAFRRMVESKEFQLWLKKELGQSDAIEAEKMRRIVTLVERDMRPENLIFETFDPEDPTCGTS
jgi:protein subunit release factor A